MALFEVDRDEEDNPVVTEHVGALPISVPLGLGSGQARERVRQSGLNGSSKTTAFGSPTHSTSRVLIGSMLRSGLRSHGITQMNHKQAVVKRSWGTNSSRI